MVGIIILILMVLPLIFQIIYGRKAIGESITLNFWEICILSVIAQFIFPIISFYLTANQMEQNGTKCGTPLAGIFSFFILFSFLLFVVIIMQYFIRKRYQD